MPVTQKDIAREAGVSQTIVSDVLQGRERGRVSAETRRRILEAAERLAYRPNASARALRLRQANQIAYLTSQPDVEAYNALSEVSVGGLVRVLSESGHRLLMQVAPSYEAQVEMLRELFAEGACDGGVVRAFDADEGVWSAFRETGRPVVVIGQCDAEGLSSVAHDAAGVVRGAVEHLHRRGHGRIAVLAREPRGTYHHLLRATWEQVSGRLGYPPDAWLQIPRDRAAAEQAVVALLAQEDAPTGLLCLDERHALGATEALRAHGRRVGTEVDLVVIGSAGHAWLYDSGTWLFGTDLEMIGRLAGEEMLRLLRGAEPRGPIRFLPELRQL